MWKTGYDNNDDNKNTEHYQAYVPDAMITIL